MLFLKTEKPRTYYVYAHWRPDKNCYFYVGKGTGRRARKMHARRAHHGNVIKKLKKLGLEAEVHIVMDNLTEAESLEIEIQTIASFKALGHPLVNMTFGGEGFSGGRHTPEWRVAQSERAIEYNKDPAIRAKKSLEMQNRMAQPEEKERHRIMMIERWENPEFRDKMISVHTNKIVSDETRAKHAESARKQWEDPDMRARIIAAKTGVPHSDETKEKISKKVRAFWDNPENIAPNAKKVLCTTNGKIYLSTAEATRQLGIKSRGNVSLVCNGKRSHANGYKFRWADEGILNVIVD